MVRPPTCDEPVDPARSAARVRHSEGVRVLVVEDEVRLARALQRGLRAEGFGVDLAHDGLDGLHLAREGGYDAVILDVMLPKLNGYRVCQSLREEHNWV